MLKDQFGLSLSTQSTDAVEAYDEAIELLLTLNLGVDELLNKAIRLDPEFALAHIARARYFQTSAQGTEAKNAMDIARRLTKRLSIRERNHIEIIALGIDGKTQQRLTLLQSHLARFPCDALPLSLALGVYGFIGFSGRIDHHQMQRDFLESIATAWGDHWWFKTFLGWSYIETGAHNLGINLLDEALIGNPHNAHAAHARAHGYYEMGDPSTGITFIRDWLPIYDKHSPLHGHISWHLALFALQTDNFDLASEVYNQSIRPVSNHANPIFKLIDSTAYLWRVKLSGKSHTQDEFSELADYVLEHFPKPNLAFVNIHTALALAASGKEQELEMHLKETQRMVGDGLQPPGQVVNSLCEGIMAFEKQDYRYAAALFADAESELSRIGGSHAQRDLIIDTMIAAYIRSDQFKLAQAKTNERSCSRAAHLDQRWLERLKP